MVVLQVTKAVIANVEVRICSPSHVDEHFSFPIRWDGKNKERRNRGEEGWKRGSHICAVAGSGVCGLAGVVVLRVTKPVIANVEVRICSPSHIDHEHFGL